MQLFTELQRRNVFRVAIGYIVSSWLLVQVADLVLDNIGSPEWVMQTIMLMLALGFPVVVFFSWAYEVTPEGIKRESEIDRSKSITHVTGRKLDRAIVAVLVIALAYFAFDKFVLDPRRDAELVEGVKQTATDQLRLQPEAAAEPDRSIAVLPFVNMSSDEEQEYFSDGLSEELLNLLAKIPDLRVAARTSSFSFKGQNLEITDIAQRLKVAHVLEGSVRKAGDQIRITAQLIKANDGYHLWSESYDRTLDNIFVIQDEIASAVVEQLKITLLGDAPTTQETDPESYALYLQARQLSNQSTVESIGKSIELFQQVISRDPNYVAAWSGLAENYIFQANWGGRSPIEGYGLAREAAKRALAIDPIYAPAHARLAQIAMTGDHDLESAARLLERALKLDPGHLNTLELSAGLYRLLGRLDEAIAVTEYIVSLDPVNNRAYYNLGVLNRFAGNFDAVISAQQTALSLAPGRVASHMMIAEALMLKGNPEAALEAIKKEQSEWRIITLPMIYHAMGRSADADAALADLINGFAEEAAYNIAYTMAFRGEPDRAFEWLDKAVLYNDPGLGDLPIETLFSSLHDDPRWLPLLESLGKSPAQLDSIVFTVELPD